MVKIRIGYLLLSGLIFVLLMNVAYASKSKLTISNVDVKIGSKTLRNLSDGTSISEQTRPGGTAEFRVEASNTFTDLEDMPIRDITVTTTIEGIDNGNDLKQESDTFNLRANTDRKLIFKFDIPLEVQQDTFNVIIQAQGQDDNNTIHNAQMRLKIEVAKDNHLLKIIGKKLTPDTVSCNRKNIQLSTTILNIGNDDEDSVTIQVSNPDLGINIADQAGGIRARPNQPDSMLSKVYPFRIPDSADAGSYPIDVRVIYDLGRKVTEETVTLNVNDCKTATISPSIPSSTQSGAATEQGGVELITPSISKAISSIVQPSVPPGAVITQESILTNPVFIAGIVIAEVVAVLLGIVLVASLFRRR